MDTVNGEIDEDDIQALEYQYDWYMRYACLPSSHRRTSEEAKSDYGRQYERYVGYLFERQGFAVNYQGIRKGLEDGGLDLVARAARKIRLVQCKRWRVPVNADVISRLHGAVERFIFEERQGKSPAMRTSIRGVLATSGEIEDEAKMLAAHFGIFVMSSLKFQRYPAIKAQRITPYGGRFLLPFTPGYDRMNLNLKAGDCFQESIRGAFLNGFCYPPYHRKILKRLREAVGKEESDSRNQVKDR